MLERIPSSCLVEALSYISHESRRLSWFRSLCPGVRAALGEDSSWRHLCQQYWYVTEERLREWPALSPQGLYRALERWTPLEGFYVLAPAFPWGLLVLVRLSEGCVLADVLRFLPRPLAQSPGAAAAAAEPGGDGDAFAEVRVPLFRVSLGEDAQGRPSSDVQSPWWPGARSASVSDLAPEDLCAGTRVAADLWDDRLGLVQQGLFATARALRVRAEEAEPAAGGGEGGVPICSGRHWEVGELCTSEADLVGRTSAMLLDMLGEARVPCDLALVRSPEQLAARDPDLPRIRPGLYVGDYGHTMYGQFRTEVLLLEYVELAGAQLQAELQAPAAVFGRPEGGDAPQELGRLPRGAAAAWTFVRGTKQCGDFHVPMGATTFVALCGPPEAAALLAAQSGQEAPRRVLDRRTGRPEEVLRAWRGWGTLALPGFMHPSWAGGWLVQLGDSSSTGDHRFGFVWDRDQSQGAIVLHWVVSQDSCPFLQRSWLPEDLR